MPSRIVLLADAMLLLTLTFACGNTESTATPAPPASLPVSPPTSAPATVTPLTTTVHASVVPPPGTATTAPTAAATTDLPPAHTATVAATPTSPLPSVGPVLGDTWTRPIDRMVMVYVPGGTFAMGRAESDPGAHKDESPPHQVTLAGFWVDQTEVTNAQFVAFLNQNGATGEGGRKLLEMGKGYCQIRQVDGVYQIGNAVKHPVVMVTWFGAEAYCQWVGGRLPTEAEWEYAARGPEGRLYPWGDNPPTCALARYGDCPRSPTAVGSFPDGVSWCGALDMAGNVWEWVGDWYGRYPALSQDNPTGPASGSVRVLRGGGWHSPAGEIRATFRLHDTAPTLYNG